MRLVDRNRQPRESRLHPSHCYERVHLYLHYPLRHCEIYRSQIPATKSELLGRKLRVVHVVSEPGHCHKNVSPRSATESTHIAPVRLHGPQAAGVYCKLAVGDCGHRSTRVRNPLIPHHAESRDTRAVRCAQARCTELSHRQHSLLRRRAGPLGPEMFPCTRTESAISAAQPRTQARVTYHQTLSDSQDQRPPMRQDCVVWNGVICKVCGHTGSRKSAQTIQTATNHEPKSRTSLFRRRERFTTEYAIVVWLQEVLLTPIDARRRVTARHITPGHLNGRFC